MKKVKQKLPITIIFLLVILILIIMSLYEFEVGLKESIQKSTNRKLIEIVQQNKERIKLKIEDTYNLMETIALFIGQSDNIYSEEIMENLRKQSKNNSFIRMAVTGAEGIGYTQDGVMLDISDREYFINGMKGENTISQVTISRIDGKESIIFAVPIYKEEEIIGVLRTVYQLEEFTELLEMKNVDKTGISLIIQSDGTSVSRPEILNGEKNFIKFLRSEKIVTEKAITQVEEYLRNDEERGLFNCSKNNHFTLIFEKIGINDWYIISIIKGEIYDEQLDNIFKISVSVIMQVLCFVGLFTVYILYLVNKGMSEIKINEERYRIISEQSDEILFEYDIIKDSITFSPKWKEKFGYKLNEDNFFEKVGKGQFIHSEEKEELIEILNDLREKNDYKELELRVLNSEGKPRWCKIRANAVHNRRNVIVKIFGEIKDINEEKKQKENLINAASRDSLTNLLNTSTVNEMVEEYLKNRKIDNVCAVIYIDIDDFKDVNDTYGHIIGDEVLKKVAIALTEVEKDNSIVGRIGGDEFFMFVKNFKTDKADEFAEKICNGIRNIKIKKDENFYLSASVGVAICSKMGMTPIDLYERADQALYEAKQEGKDQYKVYDPQ